MPFVKINKITNAGKEADMVDIEVEDNHNFILANGICVCNSAMIDVNILRLADTLLFKEPSLLQSRFERKALKDMFDKVAPLFEGMQDAVRNFYVWDDDFEGLLSYGLPLFWSDDISRSFRDFGK